MGLIFALSSIRIHAPVIDDVPFKDKGVHFVEYLVLGFLLAFATVNTWPRRRPLRTFALAVFLGAAWGFSDELHQAFVPGRSADVGDFLADCLGAATGTFLFACVWGIRRRWITMKEAS